MNNLPEESMHSRASSVLARFAVGDHDLIAKGTEAHVYALGATQILKIYGSPDSLTAVETLHKFYERASTKFVGFSIPCIREHGQEASVVYCVEDRLAGTPLASIAGFLERPQMADLYLDTVLDIRRIVVSPPYGRRKLFETSDRTGDWNEYIRNEIVSKSDSLRATLPADVLDALGPIDRLVAYFSGPYDGEDLLIHGDFHPGNVLVAGGDKASAVVDFGTFTLFGDPLYDVATACGFFSMYEPDQFTTRKRLLHRLFTRDPALDPTRVHAYLLVAALLTCDLYPDDAVPVHRTGHFQWALSVLQDPEAWGGITQHP